MNWVTVAVFDTMPDAHVIRGRLHVEGIEARIADEHLVQTDWLYAIAVGGIKVQVEEQDAARAMEVLGRDYSGDVDD